MLEGQQQEASFRLQIISLVLYLSLTPIRLAQASNPIRLSLSVRWAVGMATQVLAAAFYRSSRKFLMVLLGKPCQGFSRVSVKLLQKIPGAKVS